MLDKELYPMIFKRKSFHTFKNWKTRKDFSQEYQISQSEYEDILNAFESFERLDPEIRIAIRIAENEETSCRRGQEKVLLLYSEEKGNYLMNIGYIGEQLDLYLASKNIGALWFGLNKEKMPDHDGLIYVIMIAICKVPEISFRKDVFKSTRKPTEEIWRGSVINGVSDIVRFAPSACNTQPWITEAEKEKLNVYRYRSPKRKWVMPVEGVVHFNHIDIGIFLCFLELCLDHEGYTYERKLFIDDKNEEMNLIATYEKVLTRS